MKVLNLPASGPFAQPPEVRRSIFRLGMFLLACVMALAIAVAFHYETASADSTASAESDVRMAEMTVGTNNQLNFAKVGFIDIPDDLDGGLWNDTGSLDNVTFTHDGQNYTVNALYYTEFQGDTQYLLVHADLPLPPGLTLQFAEQQYVVADAVEIGWGESVYRWDLEGNPGWAEGSIQEVSLTAP